MGFRTKHHERNQGLPFYRSRLMDVIEEDLLNDKNITGVFYGGSIGKGNTDLFSDIDIRIIVKDEVFEAYRLSKKERARRWGIVLFFEDYPWTAHTVAHFDAFVKVDTFYYKMKGVHPSVFLQDIKIIHDPSGRLTTLKEQSMQLTYKLCMEEMEAWSSKFLAYIHEAYRSLMRGEYYSALHYVDGLRHSVAMGWYMAAGYQPNAMGDWSKIEGDRSKLTDSQKSILRQWNATAVPDEIMTVIKMLALEFQAIHQSLCDQLAIERETERIEKILVTVL